MTPTRLPLAHPEMSLKRRLSGPDPLLGLWVTLESASISEIAATMGLDWIVIDTEHGHMDFREVIDHVRASGNGQTAPLVRIQEIEEGLIKRMLDLGAEGLVVPMVRTADDVRKAVRFARYPRAGVRGISVERATRWGLRLREYLDRADRDTVIIPIIETIEAADDFDAIIDVPGIDAVYFGPFDLSASMGTGGRWGHPEVWKRIDSMRERCQARGVPVGVVARNAEEGRRRIAEGYKMIAVGFDAGLLIRATQDMMDALGRPANREPWDG